jgi:hypothetical protein
MRTTRCLVLAFTAYASTASAQTIEACKKLTADAERLACFDKVPATPSVQKPSAVKLDDPVLAKMRAAVASKLKDPESARFTETKRAMRKNARGELVDTVCGMVNAKNSYGGYTGAKPFVYLVARNTGYIVDGSEVDGVIAEMAFKNICIDGAK